LVHKNKLSNKVSFVPNDVQQEKKHDIFTAVGQRVSVGTHHNLQQGH
jgi:hypothetical protein